MAWTDEARAASAAARAAKGAAHQSGVNRITASDRAFLTPLGIKTLQHSGSAYHDEEGTWKNTYLSAAANMHGNFGY